MITNSGISSLLCIIMGVFGALGVAAAGGDLGALIQPCEDCHGKDGASQESKIPIIGGMSAAYQGDSLAAYRDKSRPCEDIKYPTGAHKGETANMCDIAGKVSEEDAAKIAEHYAATPFVRAVQTFDAALAKRGKGIHALECRKCHEDGGTSPDDDAGFLGGQWMPYLEEQFKEYAAGKRAMPEKMQPKMDKLSDDDIKALIQYYGSIQ